jgi:hypothetical protein
MKSVLSLPSVIIRIISISGIGTNDTGDVAGVMIFGAKKLKNGTTLIMSSSQPESKDREWKDRDSVGKITKTGTSYTGRLQVNKNTQEKERMGNSALDLNLLTSSSDSIVLETDYHSKEFSGPLSVSVSSYGADRLIQASAIVVDTSICDRIVEGNHKYLLISQSFSLLLLL